MKRPYEYSKGLFKIFTDSKETVKGWLPQSNQPAKAVETSEAGAILDDQSNDKVIQPGDPVQLETSSSSEADTNGDFSS